MWTAPNLETTRETIGKQDAACHQLGGGAERRGDGGRGGANLRLTLVRVDMVCNQYPERLGHCIMYKAPRVFTAFWKVAHRFLDPATAAKV